MLHTKRRSMVRGCEMKDIAAAVGFSCDDLCPRKITGSLLGVGKCRCLKFAGNSPWRAVTPLLMLFKRKALWDAFSIV